MPDHLQTLRERATYLSGRIQAKKVVGWETMWDERERAALEWAIKQLAGRE
jgi:hypothetical protein